jgi:hypothetical protein
MKMTKYASCFALVYGVICLTTFGQIILDSPVANLAERWSTNAAGWISADPLCGWANQALLFKCNVRGDTDPSFYISKLSGGSNASSGRYVGNFVNIESVSFDAIPSAFSLKPDFYFKSRSNVTWRTKFTSALEGTPDGVLVNVTIPFTYSTNWVSGWSSDKAAHFQVDSSEIVEMGFEFVRFQNDATAQQLAIDNLKLIGPWSGPFTNGVPIAWVLENGLPTTNLSAIGSADSDGDNYSNIAEYLAGTCPTNSADFFTIAIERNADGKMVLKWKNNKYSNVSYDVMKASDLMATSAFVSVSSNIVSSSEQVETHVIQEESGSQFYKVRINSKN